MITLVLGGVRSGKSALAVELARDHETAGGSVTFVATAPRIAGDDDLDARIERHRATRPAWPTIEEQLDLPRALAAAGASLVVIDCLTLWVNNLLRRGDDESAVAVQAARLAASLAGRTAPSIVISNEVGLGVHPETELGRRYRDALGRANHVVAAGADRTMLLVAGRAVRLDDPRNLL